MKKLLGGLFSLLIIQSANAMHLNNTCSSEKIDWQTTLNNQQSIMEPAEYTLLSSQQMAFQKNEAPNIVHPAVKAIPIIESNEPLVDVRNAGITRISMLPDPDKPFASPDHNSGFACASKVRQTILSKLQTMISELDRISPEFGYEPGQISIKVFEGLRDIPTQEMLFNNKFKEIRDANQALTEDEAYAETCKWVSPVRNNVPVHSTGAAVDIRLWDEKNKQFLDVGLFGVIWGKNTAAPTYSEEITNEQKNNRLLALIAAAKAGLTNYVYEHWHFSSGDRYDSFWREQDVEKRSAQYGSINN